MRRNRIIDQPRPKSRRQIDIFVGSRIRQRREDILISKLEISMGLAISIEEIDKYELGLWRVDPVLLMDFAKVLRVPLAYFYGIRNLRSLVVYPHDCRTNGLDLYAIGSSEFSYDSCTKVQKRRRNWTPKKKAEILLACKEPGRTLSEVARQYQVSPGLIVAWRRRAIDAASQQKSSNSGSSAD